MAVFNSYTGALPINGNPETKDTRLLAPTLLFANVPSHFHTVPVASNLKGGTIGVAYSEAISAQGGTSPYTYAVTAGTLPTGTTLNSSTGVISGTLSATGTFSFTITVTDANGYTGSQAFTVVIGSASTGGASNYAYFS